MAKNPSVDNFSRIMNDLKSGIYKPIYVLMGEEAYFIDQISAYIAQNVLTENEQEFNQQTFYGDNVSASGIDVAARRYPMMSERQVIIVKDAQRISGLDDMEQYALNPVPTTILVLCVRGKTLDTGQSQNREKVVKSAAFYKAALKTGEVFDSLLFKEYDDNLIPWIADYARSKGCTINHDAVALMKELLGVELTKIVREIDRLLVMLPPNTAKITSNHIELLGVSKDFNNFELCKALLQKNIKKTHIIINYFNKTPKSFEMQKLLGAIFNEFSKLFYYQMLIKKYGLFQNIPAADLQGIYDKTPAFLIEKNYDPAAKKFSATQTGKIISAIRSCDMRSKGWDDSVTESGELLRELACVILL